jgi:hypothetical protein
MSQPNVFVIEGGLPISEPDKWTSDGSLRERVDDVTMVRVGYYDAEGNKIMERLVRSDMVIDDLETSNVTATTADLAWSPIPGASSYQIERSDDDGATWSPGTPPTDTASPNTQTGLTSGDWLFRVRPIFGSVIGPAFNTGVWSNTDSATVA